MPEPDQRFQPSFPGDWPEDFSHENGNYQNQCGDCGHMFTGHKRRVICKLCAIPDTETPTAPATPALSQIRKEIESVLNRPYTTLQYPVINRLEKLLKSLLSIADMLDAENAKLKKGLVEVVDYCEKEMQPWENEGIPAYEPSIVDLHNIALSALRSIAQMEEGK